MPSYSFPSMPYRVQDLPIAMFPVARTHKLHSPDVAFHIPNPPIAPPPAPFWAASPCIFSLTFRLTSKNLLTHRSRHTLSPLLRSGSRYSGGMHFFVQDWDNLYSGTVRVCAPRGVIFKSSWIPVEHVRYHLDFGFCCGDFFRRRELGPAAEEKRHCERYGELFVATIREKLSQWLRKRLIVQKQASKITFWRRTLSSPIKSWRQKSTGESTAGFHFHFASHSG